jgi:ribosomal protein L22
MADDAGKKVDQPSEQAGQGPDPKVEQEAAEAKAEATAAATEDKPKPKRAPRKKAEPKSETAETAADATKVDKAAAAEAKDAKAPKKGAATKAKAADEEPPAGAPVVRAHAKYVRTSARKARLVCDHIRGKSVVEARAILAFTPRAVAKDWAKLLNSAVANAEHNHELLGDDLKIVAAYADEGPTLKRFQPRAMGRATQIRKRTSHLTITLTPKE